jgi:thiamine-monophosphate kinase
LQQLSRITGLGFEIDASLLPIAQHVKTVADSIDGDPVHLACSASVDFELLLGIPEHKASTAQDAAERAGTPIRSIGRCVETPTIKMLGPGGAPYQTLPGAPWDHQTNDVAEMYHAKR